LITTFAGVDGVFNSVFGVTPEIGKVVVNWLFVLTTLALLLMLGLALLPALTTLACTAAASAALAVAPKPTAPKTPKPAAPNILLPALSIMSCVTRRISLIDDA
jgi:hypothetical protein